MLGLPSLFSHGMIILSQVANMHLLSFKNLTESLLCLKLGPRRRIPNRVMRENNQAVQISSRLLPEPHAAVQQFQDLGGQLKTFSTFGHDPLQSNPALVAQRDRRFKEQYPGFNQFFYSTVNGNYSVFQDGLLFFIDISKQLEAQL